MTCRDEILQAFAALRREHGRVDFSPGEILLLAASPPTVTVERTRAETATHGMIYQPPKTLAGARTLVCLDPSWVNSSSTSTRG